MDIRIDEKTGGITIECRVTPRAGRRKIRGAQNGALLIALDTPPIEGRANEALIEFMAGILSVPKSGISILRGERGRNKLLLIKGLDKKSAIDCLAGFLPGS